MLGIEIIGIIGILTSHNQKTRVSISADSNICLICVYIHLCMCVHPGMEDIT